MITVIVPYKDASRYIRETLNSILSQTFRSFEVLCVDNGSTDDSKRIVDGVLENSDIRSRSLSFPKPGKCFALNFAIQNCETEWVGICDADDTWDQKKLEKQFFLMSEDVDVIGTQMEYIDAVGMPKAGAPLLPGSNEEIIHSVFHKQQNPICNSSVIYRKLIHTDVVGFYDPLCVVEDYDMWSRCAFAGLKFVNHPERLVYHRIHESSNFNSSQRQALHKNLIDGRNEAWKKIDVICRSS